MGPARKALRLTRAERAVLFEACVLAPLVGLALQACPLRFLLHSIEGLPRRGPERDAITADRASALASQAASFVPRSTCLTRALVVHGVLRRRGFASQIWLGATREARTIGAHAWVACDGRALTGTPQRSAVPLCGLQAHHVERAA